MKNKISMIVMIFRTSLVQQMRIQKTTKKKSAMTMVKNKKKIVKRKDGQQIYNNREKSRGKGKTN